MEALIPELVRLLAFACSLVLVALVLGAIGAGDFFAAGGWLTSDPWGIVTLFDLYFGFAITAILMAWTERDWRWSVFWITPLFFLGNVWTGLWLILRSRHLYECLSGQSLNFEAKTSRI